MNLSGEFLKKRIPVPEVSGTGLFKTRKSCLTDQLFLSETGSMVIPDENPACTLAQVFDIKNIEVSAIRNPLVAAVPA